MENRGPNNRTDGSSNDARDQKLYHYVYVVGFSILAGVIVDYLFLWPDNHLSALLVAAAGLSLVAIYEFRNSQKGLNISIPVMLFAGALVVNFIVGPIVQPDVEIIGTLQPGNEPTPPNPCDKSAKTPDQLKILMGGFAVSNDKAKITALKVGNCDVLGMDRTPEGISVNANLYDASGKLIATMANKQISVMTNDRVKATRSGDLTTLIVTNGAGVELLFVHYLNPTTIFARGIFNCPGHATVQIEAPGPLPDGICVLNSVTVN